MPVAGADTAAAIADIAGAARPLSGEDRDYDGLLAAIGDARVVMLGEATHGSREFFRERARLTRRLIAEKGFRLVIVEAPWEPSRALDGYIMGRAGAGDAAAALSGLWRFPRWFWRNGEVVDLLDHLRNFNVHNPSRPVRLFGMDLYSVPESADAVVRHLARRSIDSAARARQRYACFDQYAIEPQTYGREVAAGRRRACTAGAQQQLADLAAQRSDGEEDFLAWQSARAVRFGEEYYRIMYQPGISSWNYREQHLADTLVQLIERYSASARTVVWAHNTHQGDARATDQALASEVSLGQLMREKYGDAAFLIGFTTYQGEVRAATGWGEPDRVWRLRPALPESWTAVLHAAGDGRDFTLLFRGDPRLSAALAEPRLDRAVGVTYVRAAERASHYFKVRLSQQFDAIVHIDRTTALVPLP